MRQRRIKAYYDVVVSHPSSDDNGLRSAWRFCSDEVVQRELDLEREKLARLEADLARCGGNNLLARNVIPHVEASRFRIQRIIRLQGLRNGQIQ